MEFNFSLKRILLLIGLLAVFALLRGFETPELAADSMLSSRRVTRAWFYCMLMFISGATCASVVDHYVGTLDRSNIRLLYIIVGVVLMTAASLWIRGMRSAYENPPGETQEMTWIMPVSFSAQDSTPVTS
jgi:hypothetical protein